MNYTTLFLGLLGVLSLTATFTQAQTNFALYVHSNSNVGVSTDAPESKFHVSGSNDAKILVKNTSVGIGTQIMYNLVNDGGIRFDMTDSSTGSNWVFQNQFGTFDVTLAGTGTREFRFYPNGNLEISGSYLQASSRAIKRDIEVVNQRAVLEKVVALPINEWSYNREAGVRHIGPMSEDFYASFGLGGTDRSITTVDAGGVALAAIQGLKQEKDADIARVLDEKEAEIAELREMMLRLEMQVAAVLRNQSRELKVTSEK